jgi:hypothetical protein
VFGKLITGESEDGGEGETIEESNDLKEHMVGILFSRSKLTHLQKQVRLFNISDFNHLA